MSADLTSLLSEHVGVTYNPGGAWCTCGELLWTTTEGFIAGELRLVPGMAIGEIAHSHHLAAVITDWLAAHDREVAARAVEARADDVAYEVRQFEVGCEADAGYYDAHMEIQKMLRDRAQAIREGRATDGE